MSTTQTLQIRCIAGDEGARRGLLSVPVPRGGPWRIEVEGCRSQSRTVAVWPRSEDCPGGPKKARRALVWFASDDPLGDVQTVRLTPGAEEDAAGDPGVSVSAPLVECINQHRDDDHFHYYKDLHELVIRQGDRVIAIRPAIRNGWGLHEWQFACVEQLWSGPECAGYLAGGHIFCGLDERVSKAKQAYDTVVAPHPLDETVEVQFYIVVFRDGTAEVRAHFINGRVYHGIGPVYGMPVLLFRDLNAAAPDEGRKWTGTDPVLRVSEVAVDLSDAAHLASDAHPGRLAREGRDLLWQPFESTTLDVRTRPDHDGNIVTDVIDGSPQGLVRGAARTVKFRVSLSGAPAAVKRYLAPPAWYAANEEFAPMPLEHKDGPWTSISAMGTEAFLENSVRGKFTSGGIYRYLYQHGLGTYELSMDGNESRSLYRRCYWSPDSRVYELAERNADFCADIAVDHARDIVHYHGDRGEWNTYSMIYQRYSGLVYGHLETGDPYLLRTAMAVAHNYMNIHRTNWPRRGMGRDLDPLAGFGVLYDYTGDEHWLDFMREVAGNWTLVIGDRGQWHSGAGVGPYWGINAAEGSPWNGGHFFHGFTEYVMRAESIPDAWVEPARRGLRKLLTDLWGNEHHYHPASCGFVPRIHWYLACRLGDEELMGLVRQLMDHLLVYKDHPTDQPMFRGGKAHHMNNYLDYLLYYEATRESLPTTLAALRGKGR